MKLGLRRHGDTHDPAKGSDPIPGIGDAIEFDTDNEGGSLYVQTNDCTDLDLLPDPLAVGGTIGLALEDDSGCGALFGSTTSTLVKTTNGPTTILADNGDVAISANNGDIAVNILTAGKTHVVNDHLGNPLVTYTG